VTLAPGLDPSDDGCRYTITNNEGALFPSRYPLGTR
jgi:hypothetical protein